MSASFPATHSMASVDGSANESAASESAKASGTIFMSSVGRRAECFKVTGRHPPRCLDTFFPGRRLPRPMTTSNRGVWTAAVVAFALAAFDVAVTVAALLRPEGTGAVVGTFVRDALLVLGGVLMLLRPTWKRWVLLLALFALSLFRLFGSDPLAVAVNALAVVGIVALLLPESRKALRSGLEPAASE